jgi:imidazolonepropionase-like amidohydrolase
MGAHVAKVALNSEAGPVWGDDLLSTIVKLARASGLPVIAHAQGTGQAERALHAGVACLAHTPWTERLSDDVVRKMATSMAWISTLDIHGWGAYNQDFDRAINNLERFARWGGTVHYGTDLGNGPLPVGLNRRELAALLGAGLSVRQLLATLRGPLPHQHPTRFVTVIPDVQSVEDISGIEQLARAVIIQSPDREELQP